jgi:glutamate formiminotransferase/formiminotetrahydrofolate cyclodeaminase
MADETITKFLDSVSSSSPTPGGGSIAALAGAISCSLAEMVCNLTIGKKKYSTVEKTMKTQVDKCIELRKKFLLLIDQDAEAFTIVMKAYKEKEGVQKALKTATTIPLTTAQHCMTTIKNIREIAEKGNKNAITDAGTAALLMKAGFYAALLNVKINIKEINDVTFQQQIHNTIIQLEKNFENIFSETIAIVEREI